MITDRKSFEAANAIDQNRERGRAIEAAIAYLQQFSNVDLLPPGTVLLMCELLRVRLTPKEKEKVDV